MEEHLTCISCGRSDETVKPTTTSDRRDFKTFDRCPPCYEKRLASAYQTMNRYPEAFGPGGRGELW